MTEQLTAEQLVKEQKTAFWDIIEVFNKEGLLPYIMIIGSWAEFIYQNYFSSDFIANLRTRDVDFMYYNLHKPKGVSIRIIKSMEEKGFEYNEHRLTGISRFTKGDILLVEFLTRVLGAGEEGINEIPALNFKASGIREINMLASYPLDIECNGYKLKVPEPEAYVLQKLLINPKRKNEDKRNKDMQSIINLMDYVNRDRLKDIFNRMFKKEQKIVSRVMQEHHIEF